MSKPRYLLWALAFLAITCNEVNSKSILSIGDPSNIINGTIADDGEFPYEVQLQVAGNYFFCGGSIIGDKWILTAGHCVLDLDIISIVYGTNILYEGANRTNTTINVKRSYAHPKYALNGTNIGQVPIYDVGILELAEPIPFSDKAKPVKLADVGDIPFHVDGFFAGWGSNSTQRETSPDHLLKLKIPILTDSECSKEIAAAAHEDIFNATHNLCTGNHLNGGCYGDSGSPFVVNGIQYGIASWIVPPCATSPTSFSRIPNPEYREFIRNVTGI